MNLFELISASLLEEALFIGYAFVGTLLALILFDKMKRKEKKKHE